MERISLENELKSNSYPGRGIIIGRSADGTKAVTAYFIMGRSENSRNRVFVEDGEGIRTQAFDPSKLTDPSLIIYAPVRVLGNKTIVTNGDQICADCTVLECDGLEVNESMLTGESKPVKKKAGDELIRFEREALEAKGYCMEIMQIVMEGEHSGDVQYTTGVTAKAGETIVGIWQ